MDYVQISCKISQLPWQLAAPPIKPALDNALSCYALHCTVKNYNLPPCSAPHWTARHCPKLHCMALKCTSLHSTALHLTAVHYNALHCTLLHKYWTKNVEKYKINLKKRKNYFNIYIYRCLTNTWILIFKLTITNQ